MGVISVLLIMLKIDKYCGGRGIPYAARNIMHEYLIVRKLMHGLSFHVSESFICNGNEINFGMTFHELKVNIDRNVLEAFTQQLSEQLNADPEKVGQLLTGEQSTELRFEHAGTDMTATFGIANESRGTIAALSFFSLALRQLSRLSVTLIDEIDTSLHPTLVEELIGLFTDHKTNPYHAQLIFTTHDASLITASGATNRPIDPDQVWRVEKSVDGASEIYPVTDLKVRRDENIGKNYLNGVYGAVPKPSFHTLFARIMQENGMDS